jgi:hypothetical protein
MDSLNLGSDESILRKIPRIIINGSRYEAILTDRRIILAERETGSIYKDIPYTDIALAVSGVNAIHEPVLTITPSPSGGEQQSVALVFVYQPAGQNIQDLEKCVTILKDHKVPFQNTGLVSATTPMSRIAAVSPGLKADEESADRSTPASNRILSGRPWQPRQLPQGDIPEKSHVTTITVILVAIAVLVGGAFLAGQLLKTEQIPIQVNTTEPNVVTTVTTLPVATTTVLLPPIPTPTTALVEGSIPSQGIWAKISYPGTYSGSLGAQGWKAEVNRSGTYVFQLPVQDTTIDGSLEKSDGSADMLAVEIYNGGSLVSRSETMKPFGTIDVHVPIGPALGSSPVPTPAPQTMVIVPTPDTSLTLRTIPATGVWIRVAYPGNFSGSFGSNGNWRDVNGSGDQFYQLSMKNGLVEGTMRKSDTSAKNMIVEVYNDGTLVTWSNTSKSQGRVEIHTTV